MEEDRSLKKVNKGELLQKSQRHSAEPVSVVRVRCGLAAFPIAFVTNQAAGSWQQQR